MNAMTMTKNERVIIAENCVTVMTVITIGVFSISRGDQLHREWCQVLGIMIGPNTNKTTTIKERKQTLMCRSHLHAVIVGQRCVSAR